MHKAIAERVSIFYIKAAIKALHSRLQKHLKACFVNKFTDVPNYEGLRQDLKSILLEVLEEEEKEKEKSLEEVAQENSSYCVSSEIDPINFGGDPSN